MVVGNIPYYVTGALVPHLLGREPRPRRLSLVVQREVANRWCGLDGWSLATVGVQVFSEPRVELEPSDQCEPAAAPIRHPRVDVRPLERGHPPAVLIRIGCAPERDRARGHLELAALDRLPAEMDREVTELLALCPVH